MDYSQLSDLEINCAVGKFLPELVSFTKSGAPYTLEQDSCPAYSGSDFNEVNFDPCNSWADAGPIIQRESITLLAPNTGDYYKKWDSHGPDSDGYGYSDENPLRAAMVVFLMMQGAK